MAAGEMNALVKLRRQGVLCLWEPRMEPLLGHLQILDVGGGMFQKETLLNFWLEMRRSPLMQQ